MKIVNVVNNDVAFLFDWFLQQIIRSLNFSHDKSNVIDRIFHPFTMKCRSMCTITRLCCAGYIFKYFHVYCILSVLIYNFCELYYYSNINLSITFTVNNCCPRSLLIVLVLKWIICLNFHPDHILYTRT